MDIMSKLLDSSDDEASGNPPGPGTSTSSTVPHASIKPEIEKLGGNDAFDSEGLLMPQRASKRIRVESTTSGGGKESARLPRVQTFGGAAAFGLGTLALGVTYPDPGLRPSDSDAVALLVKAIQAGVEVIDTADAYGSGPDDMHYCERLVARALAEVGPSKAGKVFVVSKGGMRRIVPPPGDRLSNTWRPIPSLTPEGVRQRILASRSALGRPLDLWALHHADLFDPGRLVELMRAAQELSKEGGIVKQLGVCNCSLRGLQALENAGIAIAMVQNEYSLWERQAERPVPSQGVSALGKSNKSGTLEYCQQRSEKIAFVPHGALGGLKTRDGRRNLARDFPALADLATHRNCSPEVLSLAFMRRKWPCIVHIVGMRRDRLSDLARAAEIEGYLTDAEVQVIDGLRPGKR
eukprot:TRINITY_DN77670_c0_g1_i1.p1 TRINITY_DN77670_c0_g1~~TRINITY_DN77670_c0_g1_i1.p1  ORF type:complete len:408 (+),score=68.17 TRINITY_DN77670_c0_g1_i1:71-1294(+)